VSRARCRHDLHLAACTWCTSDLLAQPLRPMAVVTAWYPTLCRHPACAYRSDSGEPVGLVSRLGPCCAGCCGLPRQPPHRRDRRGRHAVATPSQEGAALWPSRT
jgi:hypothetical protein